MKTKQTNFKIVSMALLIGLFIGLSNCEEEKKNDNTALITLVAAANAGPAQPVDLPQPAVNTAILKLGEQAFVLTDLQLCRTGLGGIIISQTVATPLPTLNIHEIDFSKTGSVTLGEGGSALDIDAAGGTYGAGKNGVKGSCSATVKETTATTYDLQALDCPITKQFQANNIPDVNLSFRVRCTKQ
ncbi:hypothetical protein JWG45_06875 [Leptospira sp. 201903070]|uniref:Lipoprotein n=1 Tax=Leptospira ainlahdjerensis TaxID=2810033 RepID=A0ABS2UD80_9LEPT|nr:hypothetical protein [Leptospira ainlahdjerensis]MBM9576875.1 hypothetical protein [Leptospira ainlahdjerensis]